MSAVLVNVKQGYEMNPFNTALYFTIAVAKIVTPWQFICTPEKQLIFAPWSRKKQSALHLQI